MPHHYLSKYNQKHVEATPLAVFRVLFGVMMFVSMVRFWANGWIDKLYIKPSFFFSYYGFDWVKPVGDYTYLIFIVCALASLLVAVGYKYRLAIIVFFLSFTYIELMDKTTYLNHYYFITVLSFLLIFLPANARFSVDAFLRKKQYNEVPRWTIDSLKLLIAIVYFYAGLAKLNTDWLFRAMPLKIWLPSKYDLPIIGNNLMQQEWVHFAMSWGGAIYDLTIPFLLLYRKTRFAAFFLVVFFHIFTRVLFPIGMFPYIMIVSSLIFFDAKLHRTIIAWIQKLLPAKSRVIERISEYHCNPLSKKLVTNIVMLFFVVQLLIPWRYLMYPGELFWTEEGYRYSWRVMLIEKSGYTTFKIVDGKTKKYFYVDNTDFLTPFQEKEMSSQPDFILEYAHYLGDHFASQGHQNVEVYAESFVALNGRLSTKFIDSSVNLYNEKEFFKHKSWIVPFQHEIKIKGL